MGREGKALDHGLLASEAAVPACWLHGLARVTLCSYTETNLEKASCSSGVHGGSPAILSSSANWEGVVTSSGAKVEK